MSDTDFRELLWLACKTKSCCHTTRVVVTGADLWRIARTLSLDPPAFTQYCAAADLAPDGFRLAPNGPTYQIALRKRGAVTANGAPCVFLWKLADGHAQCGLGALRPLVCQAYPAILVDDDLVAIDASQCTCRQWSQLDLDQRAERARLRGILAEAAAYGEIVAAWNATVDSSGVDHDYAEFCRFILATYDSLAAE